MDDILIYSDSLSWGIIPDSRERLSFEKRWPGVFEKALKGSGLNVRVIENCLNGRRTVWDDPFKSGRNGSDNLAQIIEIHSPLKLVILMLGSNDFQCTHDNDSWLSAQGMAKLITIIREAPVEPCMAIPEIMIIAPPTIVKPKGKIANKFKDAELRCVGLPKELKLISDEFSTHFFDANDATEASKVDGIHLDEDQHQILGQAISNCILEKGII